MFHVLEGSPWAAQFYELSLPNLQDHWEEKDHKHDTNTVKKE